MQPDVFLLVADPGRGRAAILLLGGKATDAWGHLLGRAGTADLVRAPAWCCSSSCCGHGSEERSETIRPVRLDLRRQFQGRLRRCCSTRCRSLFVLLITGVGSLIHVYSIGYMAHDAAPAPVLRLPQPVRRGDAAAGPGDRLPAAVRRLGGRRPGVVPADRVLAAQGLRRGRREEGVRGEPGRRHRHVAGGHADVHARSARPPSRRERGRRERVDDVRHRPRPAAAARPPAASPRRCRCSPGCSTRWRARPRSRP